MNRLSFILMFLFLTSWGHLFSLQAFKETERFIIEDKNWNVYQSENFSPQIVNKKIVYQLNENIEKNPENLDLYYDFENTDQNQANYKVIFSNYDRNKYQNVNGKYSGKFYFSDHYISLLPVQTSLFSPGSNPGSFTIDFWLYLYKNYDNQYVIKYIGNNLSDEQDKNIYGLMIYTKKNHMIYEFDNFFWSDRNDSSTITITEEDSLELNKWEHHAVSFDIMNGKLTTYKNGTEQEIKWVTANGLPRAAILTPHIKDELSTPILIGKNGLFAIDNLKVSRDAQQSYYLKKYNNQNSFLLTDVYQYSSNISTLNKLNVLLSTPDFSGIKLAYRVSDRYFRPDDSLIKWVYFQNEIDDFPKEYSTGRYIQFKIQAYPYEEMNQVISIRSIQLDHSIDATPYTPVIAKATPLDGSVLVNWIPSPEDDIAGYEIYYGNRSEDYISSDATEGKSPIFVPAKDTGTLKPTEFSITGLVNERPYFISIRSVDQNGHRSRLSKEIYVRPSTVYNDKKYNIER